MASGATSPYTAVQLESTQQLYKSIDRLRVMICSPIFTPISLKQRLPRLGSFERALRHSQKRGLPMAESSVCLNNLLKFRLTVEA